MRVIVPFAAFGLAALFAASPANANSTFPYTCSNTSFQYTSTGLATIQSTCLQSNGMPHQTTLLLKGIGNQNGKLVQGTGNSTFQQSCGSIALMIEGPIVTLTAYCRMSNGSSNSTSLSLNNIANDNGKLVQK